MLTDIPPKRRTTGAYRKEASAVESAVAVLEENAPPNIPVKEKVLKQRGATVKSKRGAMKPPAKGRPAKPNKKGIAKEDAEASAQGVTGLSDEPVSTGLEEVKADTNAGKIEIQGDECVVITEETHACSTVEASVEIDTNVQDDSVKLPENIETEQQNVAWGTSENAISEELVDVDSSNKAKEVVQRRFYRTKESARGTRSEEDDTES